MKTNKKFQLIADVFENLSSSKTSIEIPKPPPSQILKEGSFGIERPKPPPCRILKEGSFGTCPRCGSSLQRKFNFLFFEFGRILGCIQIDCQNFWQYNEYVRKERRKRAQLEKYQARQTIIRSLGHRP